MLIAITKAREKRRRNIYGTSEASECSLIVCEMKLFDFKARKPAPSGASSCELEKLIEFLSRFDNLRPGMVFCWIPTKQFVCSVQFQFFFVLLILVFLSLCRFPSPGPAHATTTRAPCPRQHWISSRRTRWWTRTFRRTLDFQFWRASARSKFFFVCGQPTRLAVRKILISILAFSLPRPGTASHKLPLMRK